MVEPTSIQAMSLAVIQVSIAGAILCGFICAAVAMVRFIRGDYE